MTVWAERSTGSTSWAERSASPAPDQTAFYPKDLGNGRFSMDAAYSGLRFKNLGDNRVGLDPTGTYVGVEDSGRFSLAFFSTSWLERTAGVTSWTERTP